MTNRIKVHHLITSFWTSHGPSSGILAQIQSHGAREFAFSVWSLYAPPPTLDPRDVLHKAGLGYRVFPMGASFLDMRVLWPLVRQLRRERPDILHCHLVRANLYGRIAARLAGVKAVICTIRGIDEYVTSPDAVSRSVRLAERLSAGWVSKYVAVSETARQSMIQHLRLDPGEIVTILNAVDLAPFQGRRLDAAPLRAELGLKPQAVVVGSVGRLAPLKNYASLVRWVGELLASFPQVQLVIVGDGEERPALEDLIAAQNLADRVKLPGFRPDIPQVLGAMDIFAFPSLSEGLPRAVMEAMAAGLPCVATAAGGTAEAVVHGQTGYVVPVADAAGFKAALLRLINDEELRSRLGAAGRQRAFTLFNPARLAAQYQELYLSVLTEKKGR
jgi:glycosyltransferase involved in cell wall biosynthesis